MSSPVSQLLRLDPAADATLARQLYRQLREAIADGALSTGLRLPSTRVLARDLGVSRNTVSAAFEQLVLEGYVTARTGSGTRVAPSADGLSPADKPAPAVKPARLSRTGELLTMHERRQRPAGPAFTPGVPDPRLFPHDMWGRLLRRAARQMNFRYAGYDHYEGLPALKSAIVDHLADARGVGAGPDNVIVFSSAQAALDLTARLLVDGGETVLLEEPGYLGARIAMESVGAAIGSLPVDAAGADIATADIDAGARLIYVTPSHQYPLGAVMRLERRLALLDAAEKLNAFVIEDDYDSEYHYRGQPVPALASLDRGGRVLYLGTFAKAMIPAVRTAFMVLPDGLVEPYRRAVRNTGQVPAGAVQAGLAEFVADGHLRAHIRRVGGIYRARRDALILALDRQCPMLKALAPDGGMQLTADFVDAGVDDRMIADTLVENGIDCAPLSGFYRGKADRRGLLFGFAKPDPDEIDAGAKRMAEIYRDVVGVG